MNSNSKPTHWADRTGAILAGVGHALAQIGGHMLKERNAELAAEIERLRDEGTQVITAAYHLGHRHGRTGTAPVDDPVGAVVADVDEHQDDEPAPPLEEAPPLEQPAPPLEEAPPLEQPARRSK